MTGKFETCDNLPAPISHQLELYRESPARTTGDEVCDDIVCLSRENFSLALRPPFPCTFFPTVHPCMDRYPELHPLDEDFD
jgi:hypothetical protein